MKFQRLLKTLPLLAVIAGPAMAADLPVKAPPPVAVFNWTGFYVGGNLGYSWGRSTNNENFFAAGFGGGPGSTSCAVNGNQNNFAFCAANSDQNKLNGVIGGIEVGYNWQTNNYLVGVEADFQGSGQKGSQRFTASAPTGANFLLGGTITPIVSTLAGAYTQKLDWLGTLRGRVGVVQNRWLLFATGGLAYGEVKSNGTVSATGTATPAAAPFADCGNAASSCPFLPLGSWSDAQTRIGWTLGVGVEQAIAGNWSWKVEYLHVDLGKVTTGFATLPGCFGNNVPSGNPTASCNNVGAGNGTISGRITDEIVRVGVNYRIGGPVGAKY
jgi:outer membrane immunogenic protein